MTGKEPQIKPILQSAANSVRRMFMLKGYFVRDIFSVDKDTVDVIAIREGLMNSERWRIRLIIPSQYGGLSTIQIRDFFRDQAKVHDLRGLMISIGPISAQGASLIRKRNLNVRDMKWLEANSDFVGSAEKEG